MRWAAPAGDEKGVGRAWEGGQGGWRGKGAKRRGQEGGEGVPTFENCFVLTSADMLAALGALPPAAELSARLAGWPLATAPSLLAAAPGAATSASSSPDLPDGSEGAPFSGESAGEGGGGSWRVGDVGGMHESTIVLAKGQRHDSSSALLGVPSVSMIFSSWFMVVVPVKKGLPAATRREEWDGERDGEGDGSHGVSQCVGMRVHTAAAHCA